MTAAHPRHEVWPLFALRVRTARLELRPVDHELAWELAELAVAGIHEPDVMPFLVPWTQAEPLALQRSSMQFYWRVWADHRPDRWSLPLAVFEDGCLVGMQDVVADDFARRRTVSTGSWLGRAHQGRGIGREMRAAALHLCFAGLGAVRAESGAWPDNGPSLAVTRSLGYEPNGALRKVRGDHADEVLQFVLARDRWERLRHRPPYPDGIELDGVAPCLPLLGADGT